jgi:hypothetical protein
MGEAGMIFEAMALVWPAHKNLKRIDRQSDKI